MDFVSPRLQKIPGGGMPIAERDIYVKDLKTLRRIELVEMKERQLKLLGDRRKLQKLPDKGKRVKDLYDRIESELERRSNVDETANLFSKLNIASEGLRIINNMEWNGRLQTEKDATNHSENTLDSDDEYQIDPLRIIAQSQMKEKKVTILKPEESLITSEDLRDIEFFKKESKNAVDNEYDNSKENHINDDNNSKSGCESSTSINADLITLDLREKLPEIRTKLETLLPKNVPSFESASNTQSKCFGNTNGSFAEDAFSCDNVQIDPHIKYLIEKTEIQTNSGENSKKKEKFFPHRTTISNVHDPSKERNRKLSKNWEVTAATPPLIKHNATQMLSLIDSVEIQIQYLNKMKKLQEQLAQERLVARIKRLEERELKLPDEHILKNSIAFTKYRENLDDIVNNIEGSCQFDDEWNKTEQQIAEEDY